MSLVWMLFITFHAHSCPIELKAQLMSQFSINFENYFCKLYVSSLHLLLSHIKVNEKYDLSMTNFENWKWLLQVIRIFPIFIAFSHKRQWKIRLVHDKLWKWLLQVVRIFPIFIAFSHKHQWKIQPVLPTYNTLN